MAPAREHGTQQEITAVSGAHIHDITQVAGNLYQLFLGSPMELRARIRIHEFATLIAERTRNFVGREFAKCAVSDFLNSPLFPSGYILVRGEPGIGKTALMCSLVKERGYLHHFNIAPQNIRSSRVFLENVCAQLIVRYELDHPTLPADTGQHGAVFSQLLSEAAAKSQGPVVVVVDALDEAEDDAPAANRLYLPPVLPDGVFLIVSSREQIDYRLAVDRRQDIYLRDDDPHNLEDVRLYVRKFLDDHEEHMASLLARWSLEPSAFTELLAERSQGNFMYLVHVLADMRDGRLSPATLIRVEDLPLGLRAYYQRHWRAMRNRDTSRFEAIFEPVLRLLATVREPVSIDALEEWSSIDSARIREVIAEWRPFLNEVNCSGERHYRVYHASFQDFLAEEGIGLKPSHERIVATALRKVPGLSSSFS